MTVEEVEIVDRLGEALVELRNKAKREGLSTICETLEVRTETLWAVMLIDTNPKRRGKRK